MYIPKINAMENQIEIVNFMKRFSFATLITSINNQPIATHLPFITQIQNNQIVLSSHFAKANKHWEAIQENLNLIIFTEPHAYISTENYDTEINVPTWNYISVHAYGYGKIITNPKSVTEVIENTIDFYDTNFKNQWYNLPSDYKTKLTNGIVAFEIVVTDLQAKKKISQNRTPSEKSRIIETLSKSNHTPENLIAEYMIKESK